MNGMTKPEAQTLPPLPSLPAGAPVGGHARGEARADSQVDDGELGAYLFGFTAIYEGLI